MLPPGPFIDRYEASCCTAPATAASQGGRLLTNNSISGFAAPSVPSLSKVPILMTLVSPNVGDWLHSVEPQSPQKDSVTVMPLSAVLPNSLGAPLVTENPLLGTTRLVECVEPVILRQSRQWQRAWKWISVAVAVEARRR